MVVITREEISSVRENSLNHLGYRRSALMIQILSHLILMERRTAMALLERFEEKVKSSNLKPLPTRRIQGEKQGSSY